MGVFACSEGIETEVLKKIDWHWLETRCSPTDLSSASMMAWTQLLSDGSHLIARVIRTAPAVSGASWSVRAIVVDSIVYTELIVRMAHCLGDDNFWNRQCFVDGTATQVPNWDRDVAIAANDLALVKVAIAQIQSEGIARIDRTNECEPWQLTVRIPAALRGSNRMRIRWLVGFDNFPRGIQLLAGRYASRVTQSKSTLKNSLPNQLSGTRQHSAQKSNNSKVEEVESDPEWQVSVNRSQRSHFVVPVSCLLVICATIFFALYRVRFAN